MKLEAPFRPAGEHIMIDLPGATALFTTRRGGVSRGPFASLNLGLWTEDAPEHVRANREVLAREVGIPRERFAQGRQVHRAAVRAVREAPDPTADPVEADGQATPLGGVAPIVLVADCLPIALVADGAVAMLHGGWRGLAAGVVDEGVRTLRELGAAGTIHAAIGPGAGVCCYEAGDEVHAAFAALGPSVRSGATADLKEVARLQLAAAGVAEVHDVGLCTICSDPALFFSHRRDGGVTGRQAGVVWRS